MIFIFLSLPFLFYGCGKEEYNLNTYNMTLKYDEKSQILFGSENVEYFNNSDNMFTSLFFHLYPNAYSTDRKKCIVSQTHMDEAYSNGVDSGFIDIKNVASQGKELEFDIEGDEENILKVDLTDELYPDEKVVLEINFEVKLANINHRLGVGENTINFGNFYPVSCVYENGNGFRKDVYCSNGDPFYSECANYNVELTYPSDFIIASSGEIVKEENYDNLTKIAVKSKKARDFSFVLSKKFKKAVQKLGEIDIVYCGYSEDENINECLLTCVDALKTFNQLFGDYPYSQLIISKSNFVYGGMEYPGLVIVSDDISDQNELNYVIVHEIAHQWWYAVVGSDQINHPWQDEGLAEFSTLLFFKNNTNYGEDYDKLIESATQSYRLFERVYKNITGQFDGRMDRSLYQFETEPEYTQLTYTKGVLMFDSIMHDIGEKKLEKGLKKYYKDYAFKIATPHDLIYCLSKGSGYNLDGYIKSWLDGKVVI